MGFPVEEAALGPDEGGPETLDAFERRKAAAFDTLKEGIVVSGKCC